jgi:hypothetical protein
VLLALVSIVCGAASLPFIEAFFYGHTPRTEKVFARQVNCTRAYIRFPSILQKAADFIAGVWRNAIIVAWIVQVVHNIRFSWTKLISQRETGT